MCLAQMVASAHAKRLRSTPQSSREAMLAALEQGHWPTFIRWGFATFPEHACWQQQVDKVKRAFVVGDDISVED